MSKVSLALVAVVVVVAATFSPSLVVRAQSPTRIEYMRVTPYRQQVPESASAVHAVQERRGYRACVAGMNDWACRDFPPTQSSSDALRTTLATLGSEGWELVSAVDEDPGLGTVGLTYLFKRQVR